MLLKLEQFLDKINSPITYFMSVVAGIFLSIMTCIVLVQVLFRYVLNMPLSWTDETSRFLMIYMTYLCMPLICLTDQNIAMTILIEKLNGKRVRHLLMSIIQLLSIGLFVIWVYFGWIFFGNGAVSADSLPIPMYVIYIIPPVMMAYSSLICLQRMIAEINLFINFKK